MWMMSERDLYPVLAVAALAQVALSCLAVALSGRWWSGILAWPVPLLFGLTDPFALFIYLLVGLVAGAPTTLVLAALFYAVAKPPDQRVGNWVRGGALIAGLIAAGATVAWWP